MSWEDFIGHILATTSKVEKIAVFDGRGRPVAVSEDTDVSESEGLALVNCLIDPVKSMTKLHVENDVFLCIQGVDASFIGTSLRDHSRVVVARKDGDDVVAVFGHSAGKGSFIFELKQCLLLKAQGKLLGQQQLQQENLLLPADLIGVGGDGAAAAVSSEQVLVDLT